MYAFLESMGLYRWETVVLLVLTAWALFLWGIWKIDDNGKDMPGRDM